MRTSHRRREHFVCGSFLRAVVLLLCVFLSLDAGWTQTDEKKTELHWNFRPSLPSVFRQPSPVPTTNTFDNLPGFGGKVSPTLPPPPSSLGAQFVAGSLVDVPTEKLVPTVYVEGQGYVPINDPSIKPFLDSMGAVHPERNPHVAMIPQSVLDGTSPSSPVVMVEPSGRMLSFGTPNDVEVPIVISANSGWSRTADKHDVFFLNGDCCVRQGRNVAQGPHAVVWIERKAEASGAAREVVVYMESEVDEIPLHIEFDPENINADVSATKWSGRFATTARINTFIVRQPPPPSNDPAIYQRGLQMISSDSSVIRQVQFVQPAASPEKTPEASSPSFKRINFYSRSGGPLLDYRFNRFLDDPTQGISIFTKGFNVIIEGAAHPMLLGNVIDISADFAVIWGPNPGLSRGDGGEDGGHNEYQVYLEGNIIFRDGERRIEAHRMYYDTKTGLAYIVDAKLKTPMIGVPDVTGTIRLQAETLRRIDEKSYTAKNGFVSTSQLGEPTYSLHARTMNYDESAGRQLVVAENNYVAIGKVPIFYWPWMAADLKDPSFFLRNVAYGTDSYDGQSIRTNWNPFQLLSIRNPPSWLDADLEVKWIEMRGWGHGFDMEYQPTSDLQGYFRFWGISDSGTDNLGGRRRNVDFPHSYRYRLHWNHTQEVPSFGILSSSPWTLTAKVGKTSDHNFINSYYMNEWNDSENRTTSLELKKNLGNSSVSLVAEYALDEFYTNSNWLPRLQHSLLGASLLRDHLTWYEHTRIGLANFHTATAPIYANDGQYTWYLPWELQSGSPNAAYSWDPISGEMKPNTNTLDTWGEVFSTRHELDLPFNIGPLRCVPFVLGDYSHWGKDREYNSVDRFYGQAGVRLNLPFWKVFPQRSSRTWYVNGLTHKFDLDTEFSYARSNRSMENLILYDSLDNWSIEDARRRYWWITYGALGLPSDPACPLWADPRYYALRSGMGGRVTAANMEIADNMTLCRFGTTHRFQTKRGPVGKRRIIDWITVSAHFNYYPESKDNFDKSVGLIDYDFLWNVGDRFALFSSGINDVFEYGQNAMRIGGTWQRPDRGSLTINVDQLYGVFRQTVLMLNTQYYFNEKYAITYSTSYDMLDDWKNLGHNLMFVRTGESFRLMVGANYQEATEKWSFSFGIEPVFMHGLARKMNRTSTQMAANSAR